MPVEGMSDAQRPQGQSAQPLRSRNPPKGWPVRKVQTYLSRNPRPSGGEDVNLLSVNRERTVACTSGSKLAQVVNEALQASPLSNPTEHQADAVA